MGNAHPLSRAAPAAALDVAALRAQFPVLQQSIHGHALAYLDNAATTHMPVAVLQAMRRFEECDRANIHRGVHTLSQRATDDFEAARATVKRFIGAGPAHEVVFTSGTTESLNTIAQGLWAGGPKTAWLRPDDEIIVSGLEHHANLIPWQHAAQATGAQLRVLRPDREGRLHVADLQRLLSARTRVFAVTAGANATGERPAYEEMLQLASEAGALTVLDAAQAASHAVPDLSRLACDFMAFSGHKMYGPMGTGVTVYGNNCVGCHQAGGAGVAGGAYSFTEGSAMKTFPHIEDQLRWVYLGTAAYTAAGVTIAGAFNTGIGIRDRGVEVSVVLPDTQQYQVTLFVSGFYAVGEFTASLAGATPYVDDSFSYDGGTKPGRAYEIIAQADNPGDVLSFTYVATTIRENNSNGHVLIGAVAISAVPEPTSLALLAPLAASLIQMAISRAREYEADRGGAEICGDPNALADALTKIDRYARGIPMQVAEEHPATAQMMIMNPLSGGGLRGLFSTHPATEERIARLRAMGGWG